MNRRLTAVLLAAALATSALGSTGCKAMEKKFTPAPKIVTREATVAAPSAQVSGELAEGLPDSTPLWPGATVVESSKTQESYDFTLSTTDAYADVLAGLAAGFEQAGWEVAQEEMSEDGAGSAVITVAGDGAQGIVTVIESTQTTGTVEISYVLTVE